MFVHLTLVPYIPSAGELKTKPTQHSVKELLNVGIQPQMLLCRCDRPIPDNERRKIASFCNVRPERGDRRRWTSTRSTPCRSAITTRAWTAKCCAISACRTTPSRICRAGSASSTVVRAPEGEVRIAVVGKYTNLLDSYKSLAEALAHGGIANRVRVQLDWVDSQIFEQPDTVDAAGGRARHPGARRLRRARHGRQDRRGAVRPRAQRAVFRHLLRHADGGDRSARGIWPACPMRPSHRIRPVRRAGGRPADRMGARQRDRTPRGRRRSRRHHAPRRLSRDAGRGQPGARDLRRRAGDLASATATATR